MLSNKTGGKIGKGKGTAPGLCGHQSVGGGQFFYLHHLSFIGFIFLSVIFPLFPTMLFLLILIILIISFSLLNCFHLHPQVFSLLPFQFSLSSH